MKKREVLVKKNRCVEVGAGGRGNIKIHNYIMSGAAVHGTEVVRVGMRTEYKNTGLAFMGEFLEVEQLGSASEEK